jgi:hypothetical protein
MMSKWFDTYDHEVPPNLIRRENDEYILTLYKDHTSSYWHRFTRATGEIERYEKDPITGEALWIKCESGIIIECHEEEDIKFDAEIHISEAVKNEQNAKKKKFNETFKG